MQTPLTVQALGTRDTWSPDTRGLNFYDIDTALQHVLGLYLPHALLDHLQPHLRRLGGMVGNELDDLAHVADHNPPTLSHRNRRGEDFQVLEKHPAYQELERLAFGEFGLAAMSHRGGVLDWPEPMPPNAKYALTYLFVQSEFGLCCPVNMTDSLTRTMRRFADPALTERYLEALTSTELDALSQGAMFITEQHGGSDVGVVETEARLEDGNWRLYGEKWFCSNVDAALSFVLARPQGAGPGTRNLGLFLLPRDLPEGGRNRYRIVRLKDKLGSRSMASGEIVLEGALAFPVGELERGFVQMAEMINSSRLSNGVRAAGLMRRSLTEALHVARNRVAFGKPLIELPLMRRQLLKLMVPTEQALSMAMFTGAALQRADEGDEEARALLRILTPLIKFRATRDARKVAADSMEVRGGSGYIEEWVHPRIIRDSLLGSVWEGTSNIVALDAVQRAVGRKGAHETLAAALSGRLDEAGPALPAAYRERLTEKLAQAVAFAGEVAGHPEREEHVRSAASGLYHAAGAALLAWEGARLADTAGDARRLLLSRFVLTHRLTAHDPLALPADGWEGAAMDLLLGEGPVAPGQAAPLLTA